MDEAVKCFHKIFHEKTRNNFNDGYFKKLSKKYFHVPHSNKPIEKPYKLVDSSTLHRSVQDLLKLLMIKEIMSGVMVKFNIDMDKMPLGKIRSEQIFRGLCVLEQIQLKIESNASNESLIETSNHFYSIIPHKACSQDRLVSKEDLVKKAEMLQDLNNIQFAYEFLYKTGESGTNILDDFYVKLNTVIEPLDRNFNEFKLIKESFDSTKSNFDCGIQQIFKVTSKTEDENGNEMFNGLGNHRMLWHGDRITNINRILAHGLKIAPPEATVIGCMLGKGLYFSDTIANAVSYCYASQSNNIGVISLYEVALGISIECFEPENIEELPDGKHSVHGVGKISPKSSKYIENATISHGPLNEDSIETYFVYNQF